MIDIIVVTVGFILLILARLGLRGYYLALEDLRDQAKLEDSTAHELLPRKQELFNILFWYYFIGALVYSAYVLNLIYILVAPNLQ